MPVLSHQPSREWRHKHERDSVDDVPRYRPPDRRVDHVLRRRRKGWCRGEPSANEAEPAVDDYTLIYDLDEAPARQLVEQWPSLPDAVQVSSEEGEQLLSAARDGAGWHEQGSVGRQEQAPGGSTTSMGTASATRRVSTRSSTTPTMRCGWFQRWR